MLSFLEFILEQEDNFYHYSHAPGLASLSGEKYGSGLRGAERNRLEDTQDDRIKKRVYFYPQTSSGGVPKPESGLGGHVYKTKLENMFDARKKGEDSAKIAATAREFENQGEHPSNAFERAVLHHGYSGYHTDNMSVVLGQDVPVQYHGHASQVSYGAQNTPVAQKPQSTSILHSEPNSSGEHSSSNLSSDQSIFFSKNRGTLTSAAPSLRMEYGKLHVHSKDLPALKSELEKHPNHPL
jgi:hypothetical protein